MDPVATVRTMLEMPGRRAILPDKPVSTATAPADTLRKPSARRARADDALGRGDIDSRRIIMGRHVFTGRGVAPIAGGVRVSDAGR